MVFFDYTMKKNKNVYNDIPYKWIHFVGIKGIGMAPLAIYMKEHGIKVTGSDIDEEFPSDNMLNSMSIPYYKGFDSTHIKKGIDLVIYTGAHNGRDNVEVKEACSRKIPTLSHGQALGQVMRQYKGVSVAGCHGKTTTASMIATILASQGRDPSYVIGCGEIFGLGHSGHFGRDNIFIAEADEYITDPLHDLTPRFLWQEPNVLVVTNIDYDHPDAYASIQDIQIAFKELQNKQPKSGISIINADDKASNILRENAPCSVMTYGFSKDAELRISHISYGSFRTFFSLNQENHLVGDFTLKVAGKHNVQNATAAAAACRFFGMSWENIRSGLMKYEGCKRRMELIGSVRGIHIIDDYAHHPNEIHSTISAVHEWFSDSYLIVVFQPHTYTRTKAFIKEFGQAFLYCNEVFISEIYASAREKKTSDISAETVIREVLKYNQKVSIARNLSMVEKSLFARKKKNETVVLFMGAGNIYKWAYRLYEHIKHL